MTQHITDVAVAIFLKPDGAFLLSSRPEGKPYPHYWEFPGGKIEPGESVYAALVRELVEELNVTITHATPWFTFTMHYTHATVRLHCWRVHAWHGEMRGMEGQHFEWQHIDALTVSPTLPGCIPIFNALRLPTTYAITNAAEMGIDTYLAHLDSQLAQGLKLIQVREKSFPPDALREFAMQVTQRAHGHSAKVLLNADAKMATDVGAGFLGGIADSIARSTPFIVVLLVEKAAAIVSQAARRRRGLHDRSELVPSATVELRSPGLLAERVVMVCGACNFRRRIRRR